jgi:hypothetical protein
MICLLSDSVGLDFCHENVTLVCMCNAAVPFSEAVRMTPDDQTVTNRTYVVNSLLGVAAAAVVPSGAVPVPAVV